MSLVAVLGEQRKQEAMDQIARAALRLILRDGFDTTSVEAIASAAGCSPRTVYRYFGTKEELLFYDLPLVIAQIRDDLDKHLADGMGAWAAVSESLIALSRKVDAQGSEFLAQRINLWLTQPALRGSYMRYFIECEAAISESLHRHRGTTPDNDFLPKLMAMAALDAYRITLTHQPPGPGSRNRTKLLRKGLAALGHGLAAQETSLA